MKLRNYILVFILLFLIILVYSHFRILNKKNKTIQILQAETPDVNKIHDLLIEKSPTIFRQVLYSWDALIDLFDKDINEINNLLDKKEKFRNDIDNNLNNFSMPLSLGWEYTFEERNNNDNYFRLEKNHRHLICQILGTQRIYLASPNQTQFIETKKDNSKHNNIVSKTNFWNKQEILKEPFNKLEYIEIILREGNILYIPNGWWYLCKTEEKSLVLDCYNISFFSFFL